MPNRAADCSPTKRLRQHSEHAAILIAACLLDLTIRCRCRSKSAAIALARIGILSVEFGRWVLRRSC
jgi:hypothetical protein